MLNEHDKVFKVGLININEDILDEDFKVGGSFSDVDDFIKNFNQVNQSLDITLDYIIAFLDDKGCGSYKLSEAIKELDCVVNMEKLIMFTNLDDYYELDKVNKFKINKLEKVMKMRKIREAI